MSSLTPIRPQTLKPGDTIAVLSPSSRLNITHAAALKQATSVLVERGYVVRDLFTHDDDDAADTIQGSIATRLAEFRAAFTDPGIAAVICTIGGTTFTELLPALLADAELHAAVRAHPKIVLGCSDITGVHWFLYAVAGLRTFYGPGMIPELVRPLDAVSSTRQNRNRNKNNNDKSRSSSSGGDAGKNGGEEEEEESTVDFTARNLFAAIATSEPIGEVSRSRWYEPRLPPWLLDARLAPASAGERAPNPGWTWIRRGAGEARGRLFGGFLMAMARLAGVRGLAPDWRGRVVFLETAVADHDVRSGNPLERVRAALADLVAQGVFDEAAGLVVGRPFGYNTPAEREAYMDVVRGLLCQEGGGLLVDRDFPILFGVDIGHTTPMVTLPYDALAVLDGPNDRFAIIESGVE